MNKIQYTVLILLFFINSCFANTAQQEEYKNDYLYSDAYFDYLIECASDEYQKRVEQEKQEQELIEQASLDDIKPSETNLDENANLDMFSDEILVDGNVPFKLHIENYTTAPKYSETFKKVDSKTIIPVNSQFSFIQNMTQYRNKYNSNDYRILAGAEYSPCKFFSIASGMEANYRDIDQIPTSRKLYLTPSIFLSDKFSLSFHNKIDTSTHSTDHDIGLKLSPFKSKAMDFGVYAGLTRNPSGTHSESVNFSTNFYFF